ncbi:MAG: YjbH domain-containing protein [SAR86 cluster bacterium]|nr:YjbH domain-containing protein [SAR86 cluster bacterium]
MLRQVLLVIIITFPWYLFADDQSKNETEDKTARERVVDAGNSLGSFFVRVGDGIADGFNNVRARLSDSEDEDQEEVESEPELEKEDETEDKTARERVVNAGNSLGSFFVRVGDGIADGFNNVRARLSDSEDEDQEEAASGGVDEGNSLNNYAITIIDTTKQQKRNFDSFLDNTVGNYLPKNESSLFMNEYNLPGRTMAAGTGLIYMPSARFFPEGYMIYDRSKSGPYDHFRLNFMPFSWVEASLFYNDINTLRYGLQPQRNQSYKDKGFSFRLKLKNQGYFPALAIGLEDFAGTGLWSSEYLVGSYSYNNFDVTAGIGFGKFGLRDTLPNPLAYLNESFSYRFVGIKNLGGSLNYDSWFAGPAAYFGGLEYLVSQKYKISALLEYNSFDFDKEITYSPKMDRKYSDRFAPSNRFIERSRYNFGLRWKPTKTFQTTLAFTRGNEVSWNFSFMGNMSRVSRPLGLVEDIDRRKPVTERQKMYLELLEYFNSKGILVQNLNYDLDSKTLVIKYTQGKKNEEIDVIEEMDLYIRGSYSEIVTTIFTPKIGPHEFATIYYDNNGFNRINSDKYQTSFNPRVLYPFLEWSVSPGYKIHLGSPSGFLFGELNATARTTLVYNQNIEVDLSYIFPLINNYDDLGYFADPSDNLYPLRVNIQDYLKGGVTGPEILQVSYQENIGDHYFLAMAGNMELMLGGVHFEYLYRKTNSPFAIGADISHVQQRSFEKSFFKYQRYNSNLYNLNAYFYEDNFDLQFKFSYGKYLAKDVGYTFEVARKFRNGFTVGGFFTRTNLSAKEFGEGSFDKGIFFSVPINLFTSKNHRGGSFGDGYRPVTRDGGSKLGTTKNLFSITTLKSDYNYQ